MVLGCNCTSPASPWGHKFRVEAREQVALQWGSKARPEHSPAPVAELTVHWWFAASALGQSVGRRRSNVRRPLRGRRSLVGVDSK
jgi:hypothetical protein